MKIGIYDPYLSDIGGGEKYMLSIAEHLSKKHEVFLFWDTKGDVDACEKRFSLDLSGVYLEGNIFSKRYPSYKRIIESRKYDIIIFLSDGSIPLLLSKKLFIHVQQPLAAFQNKRLKDKIKLSRVTAFFCNSNYTKSFIEEKFHVKTEVIYPPVLFSPQKVKKENIVLHVGRFRVQEKATGANDYKKQHVMIEAFKDLVDHGLKKWKFVLCVSVLEEDLDAFEKMKKSAAGYPIEFHVNLNNKDLWEYYSRAKIYWHASGYGEDLKKHPEFAEHFGISTVEAMGAGAVPVVINAGGQREIVQDGVNGLLWSTTSELKEETLILMNSKSILEDLAGNAKKDSKKYNTDAFEEKIDAMIHS